MRPEFVDVVAPAPGLPVRKIERIDDLGRIRFARVALGDAKLAARVPAGFTSSDGTAGLKFDPAHVHVYADSLLVRGSRLMDKTVNQNAWFLVLPVFLVVAFSAVLPLMTVVNYSMQDTFGNNQFFWNGVGWFKELLDPSTDLGGRFLASLGRNLFFSAVILAIEVPLGIVVALSMPREGWTVAACLVILALPLLIPWNVVGTIWQIFGRPDIGLLGYTLNAIGIDYNYVSNAVRRLGHRHRDGRLALDQPRRAAVLCRPEVDPRGLLPGRPDRRRLALGGVQGDPAAEDEPRAADRRAAALHGFLHDLHRAVRRHRRRTRQLHDLRLDRARQDRARPVRPRQGRGAVAGL